MIPEPTAAQLEMRRRNTEHLAQLRAEQALRDRAHEIPALEKRLAALEAIAADLAAVLEGYGCPVPGHDWDAYCPRCQVFARWRTVKEAGS